MRFERFNVPEGMDPIQALNLRHLQYHEQQDAIMEEIKERAKKLMPMFIPLIDFDEGGEAEDYLEQSKNLSAIMTAIGMVAGYIAMRSKRPYEVLVSYEKGGWKQIEGLMEQGLEEYVNDHIIGARKPKTD